MKGKVLEECRRLVREMTLAEALRFRNEGFTLEPLKASLVTGRKYHKLDIGASGAFMVEAETGKVFGIKGYGVVHKHKYFGLVKDLTGQELAPLRFVSVRRLKQMKSSST